MYFNTIAIKLLVYFNIIKIISLIFCVPESSGNDVTIASNCGRVDAQKGNDLVVSEPVLRYPFSFKIGFSNYITINAGKKERNMVVHLALCWRWRYGWLESVSSSSNLKTTVSLQYNLSRIVAYIGINFSWESSYSLWCILEMFILTLFNLSLRNPVKYCFV